jgi:hypothetical protein
MGASRARGIPVAQSTRRWWWSRLAIAGAFIGAALSGGPAWANGNQTTGCVNICPGYPNATTCVLGSTVTVVPGSIIDCGTRAVQITGGDLLVHDGQFILKAASILITGHTITADCPQTSGQQGFALQTTGDITLGNAGSLHADCDAGGGPISLTAGGAISVGGTGIHTNGTAQNADAGTITLSASGTVTTTAKLEATVLSGVANGGGVSITGSSVSFANDVVVSGINSSIGQAISVEATNGDITITSPNVLSLDASTSSGDGGAISLTASGTITTSRPLRAFGTQSGSTGGLIELRANHIVVQNDVIATGGSTGGRIEMAGTTKVDIGTGASQSFSLDASGNNAGTGGEINLRSDSDDVVVAALATLMATDGASGGNGGRIDLEGIGVTANSGSTVRADGATGMFGMVYVEARGQLTLSGTVNPGDVTGGAFNYRCTASPCELPPVIGGGVTGTAYPVILASSCGDNVRYAALEQCDGADLGAQTCSSLGHGSGTLRCSTTCTYDFSGCSS